MTGAFHTMWHVPCPMRRDSRHSLQPIACSAAFTLAVMLSHPRSRDAKKVFEAALMESRRMSMSFIT